MTCCSTCQRDEIQPSDSRSNHDEELDWSSITENVATRGFRKTVVGKVFTSQWSGLCYCKNAWGGKPDQKKKKPQETRGTVVRYLTKQL